MAVSFFLHICKWSLLTELQQASKHIYICTEKVENQPEREWDYSHLSMQTSLHGVLKDTEVLESRNKVSPIGHG